MKKILLYITVIFGVYIFFYSLSLIVDYKVTSKYHVDQSIGEQIVYTKEEREKEISFLLRYFYINIGFVFLAIVSIILILFTTPKMGNKLDKG